MATNPPNAPSKNALCSIAAYLKLAGEINSKTSGKFKLPDNFITGDKNLVVGDGNCDTRKSSDNSCECEGTSDLTAYSQTDEWVSSGMVLRQVNEIKYLKQTSTYNFAGANSEIT